MTLEPLTDADEISAAADQFMATFSQGASKTTSMVGWQGGSGSFEVLYHPSLGYWGMLNRTRYDNRLAFWFGTMEPDSRDMLHITCEINPPKEGINRRTGGVFVRDDDGDVWLAHNGNIGGGRPGIGKEAFRKAARSLESETVEWPDGKTTEHYVLCRIDVPQAPLQLRRFIYEVQRFKAQVTKDGEVADDHEAGTESSFTPEFRGKRKAYSTDRSVEATVDHGVVVDALAERLERAGYRVANDQRDLFITARNGDVSHVFEVKTRLDTSAIQKAVGQVMLYTALEDPKPLRILVLPGSPTMKTRGALDQLGITVLPYAWDDGWPAFEDLWMISGLTERREA